MVALFQALASFGQIRYEDIKIDTTITGFHFAADMMGVRVYTPHGEADLNAELGSAFSFKLLQNTTFESASDYINRLIEASKSNGFLVSGVVKKDTSIRGNKAMTVTYFETKKSENYENQVFYAIVMKGTTAFVFLSGDLNNGKYIESFKKTFYAIRI